jgi:ubiquinone/menaquinone biosynthesis C-methylase UbiE
LNEENDILPDLTDSSVPKKFEKLYISLRQKENRIYTDDQVLHLPFIESSHLHAAEWEIRGRSATRLLKYLREKNRGLTILEAGCGNGWLTAKLGDLSGSTITGIDINEPELTQAKRIFRSRTNIHFSFSDIKNMPLDQKFDMVVFAASFQYFPSFDQTVGKALSILHPGGEIHILDSPFYRGPEIADAEQRSEIYYRSVGYPEMSKFYFHHTIDSFEKYNHRILFDPFHLVNKLFRKDPFPWICIKAS